MKEERQLKERIKLLEKEIQTLTLELQSLSERVDEINDLRFELKGIKLFLSQQYPDFKNRLPELIKKLKSEA
ncbi:MAG: hypothetical protein D6710_11105 [Nitrospirae bacterium]|nr:MAG: hypothetical protein D6710_11105 [Nitrospirota bacterium]